MSIDEPDGHPIALLDPSAKDNAQSRAITPNMRQRMMVTGCEKGARTVLDANSMASQRARGSGPWRRQPAGQTEEASGRANGESACLDIRRTIQRG